MSRNEFYEMYPVIVPNGESPWCKFNASVGCTDKAKCKVCGWNPAVDEARKKKTRERLNEQQE